ncbi:glycoside hydrolase family 1 protein [Candidatus Daviesbacteria bacterium]|nr:glycoside hydrolase family 1 protein [Candidatus Daviesbacteria bacterium]
MSDNLPKAIHDHNTLKFPEGFLWGSATSAHQVEGANINNDWWQWEAQRPLSFRSGLASDQYNRYEGDFELVKNLGHNAHRLGVEWSRIEPADGEFDTSEIRHYQQVLNSLKDKKIKIMLTLWHFTLPLWVAKKGGWENPKISFYFERFVKRLVPEIKDFVDFWITLNEPTVYLYNLYIDPKWPGGKKTWLLRNIKTFFNFTSAHKKTYRVLKLLDPNKPVGIANNIQSFEPFHKHSIPEQLAVVFSDIVTNHMFYFFTKGTHDFLGVNYYFHYRLDHFPTISRPKKLFSALVGDKQKFRDVSDLGWEIYPEGIFDILIDLKNHLPVYITECGIASTNDDRRTRFLIHYLQEIFRAIKSGVNVKGFFYWSLLDNFEWHLGFNPRFGLVEIDYGNNQKRTVRPSAYVYKEIAETNGIPHKLLKLLGHGMRVEELIKV